MNANEVTTAARPPGRLPSATVNDSRLFYGAAGLAGAIAYVTVSSHTVFLWGAQSASLRSAVAASLPDITIRIAANLIAIISLFIVCVLARVPERMPRTWAWLVPAMVLIAVVVRVIIHQVTGLRPRYDMPPLLNDLAFVAVMSMAVLASGLAAVSVVRYVRATDEARAGDALHAAEDLALVREEELQVRRRIADELHGTVQNRLVLLETELTDIAETLPPESARRVRAVSDALDEVREKEVRLASASLYPESFDRGLVPAIRALVRRVPASIDIDIDIDETAVAAVDRGLDTTGRLLIVRATEEALTNALRHGKATRLTVSLDTDDDDLVLRFADNGEGFGADVELSGLARLRHSLRRAGGDLQVVSRPGDGTVVSARAPARLGEAC
ncbi:sensor histidine kinase [Microbacterium sp. 18062]|uniref:sensor histidine kinase n=1 Tax=Microbacterium sp. 18062 TaxID=2681410 RepID=UPI00135B9D35|nr:ATP-binding protein [Microbacterium sp. 18062]